jgi:hypothetical protein
VDAYVRAVRSTLEMAPSRKKVDINLIFAYGIMSDRLTGSSWYFRYVP